MCGAQQLTGVCSEARSTIRDSAGVIGLRQAVTADRMSACSERINIELHRKSWAKRTYSKEELEHKDLVHA